MSNQALMEKLLPENCCCLGRLLPPYGQSFSAFIVASTSWGHWSIIIAGAGITAFRAVVTAAMSRTISKFAVRPATCSRADLIRVAMGQ